MFVGMLQFLKNTAVSRKNSLTGSSSSNGLAHQEPSSKATSADDVIDSGGTNHGGAGSGTLLARTVG